MYLNIIILPLISLLVIGIFGRFIGNKGLLKISLINISIIMIIVLLLIYENGILKLNLWNSINTDLFNVNMYLYLDDLAQLMLLVVISITYIVLIYSYDYMISDPHIIRFYFYIILFVFFMIILITTNSLPILFIGWEGVGLSSFLLISFWYTRFQAQLGALLALLMNRVGDIFYLIGLITSLVWLGSLDIISISCTEYYINWDYILISFFIAAMAKSAQVYLHLWLPYSMEGPTPISALIHAATMVTAGVFLLLRLNQLIITSYYTLIIIIFIGGLTAFIGGTLAIVSLDLKELIAYSTMSQLGYMITILGLKGNNLSFFHLIFHAYFKALLFLTAGAIIHTILDLQDFRKTGGLLKILPVQTILSIIGLTSLIGFPFTTGFYSKENILNNAYSSCIYILGQYSYIILIISALLTIAYSYRFFYIIFLGETKLSISALKNVHFFSLHLLIPLTILGFLTIFIGYILSKWVHFNNIYIFSISFDTPLIIKLLPILFMLFVLFFYSFSSFSFNFKYSFLLKQYSFKLLYQFISGIFFAIGYRIFIKIFDYGILDLLGPITGRFIIQKSSKIDNNINSLNTISFILFIIFIFSI